jgi:acyl-CoA reductase-like NAD-dependent aldehyde dehydrogenase
MSTITHAAPFEHPDRLFIGGEWATPSGVGKIDVVSSSTEELYVSVAAAQKPDVERAVAAARKAFDHGPWPRITPIERAVYLRAIADEFRARAQDFAHVWTTETGVTHAQSVATCEGLGAVFDYYAGLADTFSFIEERTPRAGGNVGFVVHEPVGTVAAIIPWNGPGILIAYKCAPALLAGCTMIVKASPEAPGAAYIFAEICKKVGLPAGVLNILTADREVSELLVRHPGIDKVTFTGSTIAGRRIASICGERIARCTLELGGKSAAVILDDYDIETAAETIAAVATFMTGQVCASLTRIVVTQRRHDSLVEALGEAFKRVKVGDPFDASSQMGPLAISRQRDRVEGYIARGLEQGATLAAGGVRPVHLDRGYYIEPTVFGNVSNDHTIAQEEIFGPVLSVIPARNETDAIDIANATIFGLNNSVFTNDADRAFSVARRLRSGTVGHNSFRLDHALGFGGFKQSGIGREGGIEGLYPFLESKAVIMDARPSTFTQAT